MSMAILSSGPDVNALQLHGMLTGDLKQATRLEGWEAFKNFFIKLLNHLPGMHLEDKEKALRAIYDKIYGSEQSENEKTHSSEKTWHALENLISLLHADDVHAMQFTFSSREYSQHPNEPDNKTLLHITLRDQYTLPDISLDNAVMATIQATFMKSTGNNLNVCRLNPEILTPNESGNGIRIAPEALQSASKGFAIASRLNEAYSLIESGISECHEAREQVNHLEYNQQFIDFLSIDLPSDSPVKRAEPDIKRAIANLETLKNEQQAHFQKINHELIHSMTMQWTNVLGQEKSLNKQTLTEDKNTLQSFLTHSQLLLTPEDALVLQQIQEQLPLVEQVADLQSHVRASNTLHEPLFSAINKSLKSTSGPLTSLLTGCMTKIADQFPQTAIVGQFMAENHQNSEKVSSTLKHYETMLDHLLSNPDKDVNIEEGMLQEILEATNSLPSSLPSKVTFIERINVILQQAHTLNNIENGIKKGGLVDERGFIQHSRPELLAYLQQENAKLPDCQRKEYYQVQITELNILMTGLQIDACRMLQEGVPQGVKAPSLDSAFSALKKLSEELTLPPTKIDEYKDQIDSLCLQNENMRKIAQTLQECKKHGNREVPKDIVILNDTLPDCERKIYYTTQIKALNEQAKLCSLQAHLIEMHKHAANINMYRVPNGSNELVVSFNKWKSEINAFPDSPEKQQLLKDADVIREKINSIKKEESAFLNIIEQLKTMLPHPSQDWQATLKDITNAAQKSKDAEKNTRNDSLTNLLGQAINTAFTHLQQMIANDDRVQHTKPNAMADMEPDYIVLRDALHLLKGKLSNFEEIEKKRKELKKENGFQGRQGPGLWSFLSR